MLKIKVNKDKNIEYKQENGQIIIDDQVFAIDIQTLSNKQFHILKDNKSYSAEFINFDPTTKTFLLKVDGEKFEVEIKEKLDLLLEKMGMNESNSIQVEEIKAPMPGLIIDIKVSEGQEVELGETIMILEAMKMENILKSPRKGIIKSIKVKKGQSVEKNQLLIQF
jgi:biotin carboxyl carrier protein